MRVSVPVAVWGEGWGGFAPEWFDAVEAMTRKPDEIVIGLEDPDRAHVHIRDLRNINMRVVTLEPGGFNDYWNQVFDACTGDWIAPCCIDDRFLPDALAEIVNLKAERDVMAERCRAAEEREKMVRAENNRLRTRGTDS